RRQPLHSILFPYTTLFRSQVLAVWAALQKRGIKYSSTTTTPGGSSEVYSQYIRFVDQSIDNTQANCADGSVLFASMLRKLSIKPDRKSTRLNSSHLGISYA